MKKTYWIIGKAFRFCAPYILVNITVMMLTTGLSLSVTVLNQSVINELVNSISAGCIGTSFIILVAVYMVLYFLQSSGGFLLAYGSNFFRLNVDSLFHRIFMCKSNQTPQELFFNSEFMTKYEFVSGNTNRISSFIGNWCSLLFLKISALVGSIVLFAVNEPRLIIYAIVIGIMTLRINYVFSNKEYELDKSQANGQRFHNYYKGILTEKKSAKELRVYGLEEFFYNKWQAIYNTLRIEQLELNLRKIDISNSHKVIKLLLRFGAIVLLMAGVYDRRYDLGTLVMLLGLTNKCVEQVDGLAQNLMQGSYKDVKYLNDYYDFVYPITNEKIKEILNGKQNSPYKLSYGDFFELKANHVTFSYPNGNKNAVEDVSLEIRKGEIISILGYNGSGKTTLSKLLSGSLFPQSGQVSINNVPITKENQRDMFTYFGIAPQEFPHFILPLRDVVGLGCIEKMNERSELELTYEKSGLSHLIQKYSKGENTVLGKEYDEEGVELSGGEWQRLIIASAYMGQPEVLILDEPTASIDPLKEMEMLHNFRKNLGGKTAILISHRIGFARFADRIIMMENGKIAEQGSHEELLQMDGIYARLFKVQKELYEEAPDEKGKK